MNSKKNKHCILETSIGTYVVSSFRDHEEGRFFIVDDFTTTDLETARNVAKSRALDLGGEWHDAPGYESAPPGVALASTATAPHTTPDSKESNMSTELNEKIAELEKKIEMLETVECYRRERFETKMQALDRVLDGHPDNKFMRSVIRQLTDDCYTAALADEAIKREIKAQILESAFERLDEMRDTILQEVRENLQVDVSCVL